MSNTKRNDGIEHEGRGVHMSEMILVPFRDEAIELNEQCECIWEMNGALSEVEDIVKRARVPKEKKAALLAQIDHILMHLSDGTRMRCNDVKDRRN